MIGRAWLLAQRLGEKVGLRRGHVVAAQFVAFRLSQYAILFIAGLVSARALGPSGRAHYALPLALGSSVFLIVHISLDAATARFYARGEAQLTELVGIRVTGVLVTGVIGFGLAIALGVAFAGRLVGNADLGTLVLGALTAPLWVAVSAAGTVLLMSGRTAEYARAGLIAACSQFALLISIIAATTLTPDLALITVVVGLAANAATFGVIVVRIVGLSGLIPSGDWRLFHRLVRVGLQIHPAAVALGFSLQIDLFCIAALRSTSDVGLYSLAAMIASNVFLAISALSQVAFPRQMHPDARTAADYTVAFTRKMLLLTAVFAGIGMILGYPLIWLLYGPSWTPSTVPFLILTLATVPLMVQGPTTVFLYRSARPVIFAVAGVAAVLIERRP